MRFTTETGSVYEIRDVNGLHREVRRVNHGMGKRADGEWVRLISHTAIEPGVPVTLEMASLSPYGPDDAGHYAGGPTVRRTSPVTHITEGEA